jgi:hypothetical protein
VQLAENLDQPDPIPDHEPFVRRRQQELRELFAAGRGAW